MQTLCGWRGGCQQGMFLSEVHHLKKVKTILNPLHSKSENGIILFLSSPVKKQPNKNNQQGPTFNSKKSVALDASHKVVSLSTKIIVS